SFGSGADFYITDSSAYNHVNAQLVLEGRNPYTSPDAWVRATLQSPNAVPTPIELGRWEHVGRMPRGKRISTLAERKLARHEPIGPEFDERTLASYPALSFLVNVPTLWLGAGNTAPGSIVVFAALTALLAAALPRRLRAAGILVLLGNLFAFT